MTSLVKSGPPSAMPLPRAARAASPGGPRFARRFGFVRKAGALTWAITVSVAVHAVLLTVRFVDPEGFNRIFKDTPLEVVLVNAKSTERPQKAQTMAQVNLAGGGEAEKGIATSPLPPSKVDQAGESAEDTRKQIQQLQEQQQQILAQVRRELAMLPPPDPQRDQGNPQAREQEEKRQQLLRHLAAIEKRINEENARPKKRYISPATQETIYAMYYDALRRKIEERGTRDFPEHQGKKLYGSLVMNITVDAAGRVVEADVVQRSESRVLDRRAIAIVQSAAPFGPFTPAMRKEADQIVVTSRFRFTREQALEATPEASVR
jgi:protein TonB